MTRKWKTLFLSIICFVRTFTVNSLATQQIYTVSISGVQQAKSEWCWAACAEMAGKSKYPSSARTQWSVVNYVKGFPGNPYPDWAGDLNDSVDGSEYMTYNTVNFSYHSSFPWLFSEIVSSIQTGNPIEAGLSKYQEGHRIAGHMVVIYGIHISQGDVFFIDPWDNSVHIYSYSQFTGGAYDGWVYDQTVFVD